MAQRREAHVRPGRDLGRRLACQRIAPDVGHRHDGEVGMTFQEALDLPLVLGRQHRAGGVDQAAARLHQPRRGVEDRGLLGHQLGEILGPQRPAAVGIAPPRAAAGAGRVDQHAVEGERLALQPFAVVGVDRATLDIVGAGAAQALGRAVEARLEHVHGHDPALVVHAGRHGERLAAGAGADSRRPACRAGHRPAAATSCEPSSWISTSAVLEGLARHHRQAALEPQPVAGIAHRLGLDALALQRRAGLLDRGLEAVDPEVDRRRRLQRGDLAAPRLAVGLLEMRRHPFLDVEPHPVGLLGMGQRMALHLAQRAELHLVERRRPVGASPDPAATGSIPNSVHLRSRRSRRSRPTRPRRSLRRRSLAAVAACSLCSRRAWQPPQPPAAGATSAAVAASAAGRGNLRSRGSRRSRSGKL